MPEDSVRSNDRDAVIHRVDHPPRIISIRLISMAGDDTVAAALKALGERYPSEMTESVGLEGN